MKYYGGENAVEGFLPDTIQEKCELTDILTHIVPIHKTPQDEE